MHLDVTEGRVTLSGSGEQLQVVWNGTEGPVVAEFRVGGDTARLASIGVEHPRSEKALMVGDPSLEDVPREYRLLLQGAGYELREPGEVLGT